MGTESCTATVDDSCVIDTLKEEINNVINAYVEIWDHKAESLKNADTDLLDAAKMKIKATTGEELKLAINKVLESHGG